MAYNLMITMISVPSPPEGVTFSPLSEGEVKLMWKPPTQRNGVIIFYIIQYHPELEDPEPLWTSMHSNGQYSVYVLYLHEFIVMYVIMLHFFNLIFNKKKLPI